ncbi:MAG: pilus assembly PilX N-terminal domain-containing protein [Candidatus Parcubacteria bacterium]|nr:pilus assembly PilX N-terminal domain-containing protein [Candidatus Parcubacteria bacterium]
MILFKNTIQKKSNQPKGQVLLMTVLVFAAVSVLGLILVEMYIKDLRLAYGVNQSTQAIYAADSCQELCLYKILQCDVLEKGGDPLWDPLCIGLTNGSVTTPTDFGDFDSVSSNPNPACQINVCTKDLLQVTGRDGQNRTRRGMEIYLPASYL